jgi:hypothetical protein
MATPSEGGQSYCEGVQDELGDTLMRTVNIISSFFEMLDLDKNGNVELADLHRMQVSDSALCKGRCFSLQCCTAAACTCLCLRPYVSRQTESVIVCSTLACTWCYMHGTIDILETCYISDSSGANKQLRRVPLVYAHTSFHCMPLLHCWKQVLGLCAQHQQLTSNSQARLT